MTPAPKLTARDIRAFMARHGLSQSETARRAGIARQTLIAYLNNGTDNADPHKLAALVSFMRRVDRRKGGTKQAR